jgi:hypothetical protein
MQNNTTLEDLLPRWSQIAPGECSVDGRSNTASLHLNGETYLGVILHQSDAIYAPEFEYHVRRCIEARGWDWSVGKVSEGVYSGKIWARQIYLTKKPSPAAALLSAYLEALEALTNAG